MQRRSAMRQTNSAMPQTGPAMRQASRRRLSEDGFALIGLVVAIFLILLVLAVAAPRVAHELRRDKEVEAAHRANQYVRAVQLYFRKFGRYPGSMEQLEKTNNIRFLRQKYVDPLTGKADWRIIHVGEAKTTVKGLFGKPLTGLAPGLGSAAGMASSGMIGAGATGGTSGSGFGNSSTGGSGLGNGISNGMGNSSSGFGTSSAAGTFASGSGTNAATSASSGTGSTSGSNGIASQSATDFKGAGAPFVGVGSSATGNAILELNEQTTYGTWEFIYDPRIEQLKARAGLFGGPASTGATGLGSAAGNMSSGFGSTTTPTSASPGSQTLPTQGTNPP
jgi:type II secretory pathway pseudopilin PulG